ncbi:hypothetical protein EYZ11_012090 [Aspergillus tanneri]|uniref:Glycosyl hydrolase family 92 domain-containing protein n=1 Tax=Aspergillus tanneri TaxID=1220188 RepID=A0A4S3J1E9_9EURO|nr:hypothetical protein EYZ11_012090 [Aspergillus tanneri]
MALGSALLVLTLVKPAVWAATLTSHVNPFLGSAGGGNNFPGVARPFGMVKLGPDLHDPGKDAYSGYLPHGEFSGFSMMHEQGTGGAPKYGTVSQLPLASISIPSLRDHMGASWWTSLTYCLLSEVKVLVKVTKVETSPSSMIAIMKVTVFMTMVGTVLQIGGYFDTAPINNKTYVGTDAGGSEEQTGGFATSSSSSNRVGGVFSFQESAVTSRVGISWISTEKACRHVQDEIPEGTDLHSVVQDAQSEWESKVLSKVTTTSTNQTSLTLLYTSLYFMHLIPTNQTGENPKWSSEEPYYQDIFTYWDLFRCSTALMQVLQPEAYEEQIRSLIDIWRFDGYLPDARSSNYNGRTQGGSNADNILADAYVKGVRGAVNWDDGYRAMVKDAEVAPPNDPVDPMAPDSSTKEGRGALPDWIKLGFITPRYTRAVTRAVEYSCNDFGLYQVASGLGKNDDAEKYLNRSRNWQNHWNPNTTSLGFSGFVVPRDENGFIDTDPLRDGGYWGDPYYEANSWAYSWASVHDMKQVIDMMGGAQTVVKRLDTMFTKGVDGSSGTIFDSTNEPMFNIPYLYNYVNRQDLSVSQSRNIAKTYYLTGANGLPGNSDAGAMQTWLLWNMIGLYPVTGQTTFLIHSPWFESLTIELGGGKKLHVTAKGGDGNGDSNIQVQRLQVNGKDWRKNWLTWDDIFADGGSLDFELGGSPSNWFTGELPPSPAS